MNRRGANEEIYARLLIKGHTQTERDRGGESGSGGERVIDYERSGRGERGDDFDG